MSAWTRGVGELLTESPETEIGCRVEGRDNCYQAEIFGEGLYQRFTAETRDEVEEMVLTQLEHYSDI